jgi:hypothetical protein
MDRPRPVARHAPSRLRASDQARGLSDVEPAKRGRAGKPPYRGLMPEGAESYAKAFSATCIRR